MAEKQQMRPASKELAPDPATSYERAKPDKEAGMGRLDNNDSTPADSPDRMEQAVTHKQSGGRQLNGHEVVNDRASRPADGSRLNQPEQGANS